MKLFFALWVILAVAIGLILGVCYLLSLLFTVLPAALTICIIVMILTGIGAAFFAVSEQS